MNRILVVRLGAMGDIVHSLPAVAALRKSFPQAVIGWLVDRRWADLLSAPPALGQQQRSAGRPLVDAVHLVSTRSWRASPFSAFTWNQVSESIRELRSLEYEVAVDMQAAFRSALLGRLSGAPRRIGFAKPREAIAKIFYTQAVATAGAHMVQQGLELANAVSGGKEISAQFPFPCDPEAERWCDDEMKSRQIGNFALMNPGAGWGAKCWPAGRYAAVARALAGDGLRTLINTGPGEGPLANAVEEGSGGAAVSIACSVAQLLALVRRATIFIGGDTGPVHLAAANGVPVVAIYGPTDPVRNGPFAPDGATGSRIAVLRRAESQTSHSRRSQPESGLLQITVEDVLAAARNLLRMNS